MIVKSKTDREMTKEMYVWNKKVKNYCSKEKNVADGYLSSPWNHYCLGR